MRAAHLSLAVLLVLVTAQAAASPSAQVTIPSPDVQTPSTLHLVPAVASAPSFDRLAPTTLGLTFGLFNSALFSLEGGTDLDYDGGPDPRYSGSVSADLKLVVPEQALADWAPAIAVGGYQLGPGRANIAYAVVARSFGTLGRFSVGLFAGDPLVLTGPDGRPDHLGLMVSWDRSLPELADGLWVGVDYQSSQSSVGAVSAGVYWSFLPFVSVAVCGSVFTSREVGGPPTLAAQLEFDTP